MATPEAIKKQLLPGIEISNQLMSLCIELENNPKAREKIGVVTDPRLFIKKAKELGFTVEIEELEKFPFSDETLDLFCMDSAPFFTEAINRLLISGDYCQ